MIPRLLPSRNTTIIHQFLHKQEICSNRKFGSYKKYILARELFLWNKETEMYEKKILGFNKKIRTKLASPPQQKTDTTAQLYCTLSTYVTPTPISRQNQNH